MPSARKPRESKVARPASLASGAVNQESALEELARVAVTFVSVMLVRSKRVGGRASEGARRSRGMWVDSIKAARRVVRVCCAPGCQRLATVAPFYAVAAFRRTLVGHHAHDVPHVPSARWPAALGAAGLQVDLVRRLERHRVVAVDDRTRMADNLCVVCVMIGSINALTSSVHERQVRTSGRCGQAPWLDLRNKCECKAHITLPRLRPYSSRPVGGACGARRWRPLPSARGCSA